MFFVFVADKRPGQDVEAEDVTPDKKSRLKLDLQQPCASGQHLQVAVDVHREQSGAAAVPKGRYGGSVYQKYMYKCV